MRRLTHQVEGVVRMKTVITDDKTKAMLMDAIKETVLDVVVLVADKVSESAKNMKQAK